MKSLRCFIFLVLVAVMVVSITFTHAQDYRARIYARGYIEKISVLPDESIWLGTRVGELYYTDHFDKSWHYKFRSDEMAGHDHYREVIGFRNGTMLVVGQISRDGGYHPDAVLRSTDRGKNWEMVKFTETETLQVQAMDYNDRGEVWIGGGPGRFFYSSDFASTWEERTPPFTGATRIYAIAMLKGKEGFVGSHDGKISSTIDSATSWQSIAIPYQQGMYKLKEKHWTLLKVDRIGVSGKFLVVRQGGRVFYSDLEDIRWKSFKDTLIDFAVDRQTFMLTAINDSGEVLFFNERLEPEQRTGNLHIHDVIDMTAQGGKVYALDQRYNVYHGTRAEVRKAMLLTADYPIESPAVQRKATLMKWGATGIDLFNAPYNSSKWYRIKTLNFPIQDIRLLNDDEAILWDGHGQNYYYNRVTDSLGVYKDTRPISDFLSQKVEQIEIRAWSQGCFHFQTSGITYSLGADDQFVMEKLTDDDGREVKWRSAPKIDYAIINDLLREINDYPDKSFTVRDLNISEHDLQGYRKLVANHNRSSLEKMKAARAEYFQEAINHLDTLRAETVRTLLGSPDMIWSTTTNAMEVVFTNRKGDKLTFTNRSYRGNASFFLPWHLNYEPTHLNITNLKFSEAIRKMIPDDFMFAEGFDPNRLLYQLAEGCYDTANRVNR